MLRFLNLLPCLATLVILGGCYPCKDGGKRAGTVDKPLEWHWSKEKASLAYCVTRNLPDVEVERVSTKFFWGPINFRRRLDRKVLYTIEDGGDHIVFTRWKDVLYIADYDDVGSGCSIVAVDIKTGQQLWKSKLQALGEVDHLKYANLINIEANGGTIVVAGNESYGRYVELLDVKTGQTLVNKIFDRDVKPVLSD